MNSAPIRVCYRMIPANDIDLIRPLWEELGAYHLPLSPRLRPVRESRKFEKRRAELLEKASQGHLMIEVAALAQPDGGADTTAASAPIGCCISSVTPSGAGELETLFVQEAYRCAGIGEALVRSALAWMDTRGATSRTVKVGHGNQRALEFYRRFGFCEDIVVMRHAPE